MAKKNTVIVLGSGLGRVGSSALMGLLRLSNVNIGGRQSGLGNASASNPKGHFEPPAIKQFLSSVFPKSFPGLATVPTIKQLRLCGRKHHAEFNQLLAAEFGHVYPIALKGGRLLVLPFLQPLQANLDVKVLMLQREPKDQIASIIRVWRKSAKLRKHATVQHIAPILSRWTTFVKSVRDAYTNFDYLDIQFNSLIDAPVPTMRKITSFAGITCPNHKGIMNWIDPRLVHRK